MAVSTIHHPAHHTEPVRWQSYRKTESQHAAETAQPAPTAEWVLWRYTHQMLMCFQHVLNMLRTSKSTKSDVISFAQTVNACCTSQNSPSQLHTAYTICISYLTKPGAFTNQTNKGLNNHKHINLTQKAARCLPLLTQMQVFNCLHLTSHILKWDATR